MLAVANVGANYVLGFAVETAELYESDTRREAIGNATVNLVGALLAVGLGGWLATALA